MSRTYKDKKSIKPASDKAPLRKRKLLERRASRRALRRALRLNLLETE